MRKVVISLSLIMVMVFLAACGSSQPAPTNPPGNPSPESSQNLPDPCLLIIKEEVREIFDNTPVDGTSSVGRFESECIYNDTNGNTILTVYLGVAKQGNTDMFEALKSPSYIKPTPIAGLGEDAFYDAGTTLALYIRKGTLYAQIYSSAASFRGDLTRLQLAAALVVARMP
ncbi:MAG TPA: hypothetical protein PLD47_13810 [Aggregatilineales bacterium]|nr:hypothetical protein [Anaerolineales bacterium]HRE48797.1 hypothetical protein [Aggregatilineales bacterium]